MLKALVCVLLTLVFTVNTQYVLADTQADFYPDISEWSNEFTFTDEVELESLSADRASYTIGDVYSTDSGILEHIAIYADGAVVNGDLLVIAHFNGGILTSIDTVNLSESLFIGDEADIYIGSEFSELNKAFVIDSFESLTPLSDAKALDMTVYTDLSANWSVSETNPHQLDKYLSDTTDVVVPVFNNGYTVTKVGGVPTADGGYVNICDTLEISDITSITIPNGVETIGAAAFLGATSVKGDLVLPDSVRVIEPAAFAQCGFDGELVLNNGLETIWHMAFRQTPFSGSLVIPDTTLYLGNQAFLLCGFGGTLTIGENVSTIGDFCFQQTGFSGDIVIPDSVVTIGKQSFYASAFDGGIKIGKGTTLIDANAFLACPNLTGSLELSEGLVEIGQAAFANSGGLTGDLIIPDTVVAIGNAAFANAGGFNGRLVIGKNVKSIGNQAFAGSATAPSGYTSLVLPDGLESIGAYAFQYCLSVAEDLVLPEGLKTLGDGAFVHCRALTNKTLKIPASLETIGGDMGVTENTGYGAHVFYDFGTSAFVGFDVSENNSSFKAVDGVLFSKSGERLIAYPKGKTDSTYIIPDGVTQLDENSFSVNYTLKKLVLPDSFKISEEIPQNALNIDGNSLSSALYVYTGVEEIAVNDSNPYYSTADGILYSKDLTELWYCPNSKKGIIEIPEGTISVKKGAFYATAGNCGWEGLHVPASLEYFDNTKTTNINGSAGTTPLTVVNKILKDKITLADGNKVFTVSDGQLYTR